MIKIYLIEMKGVSSFFFFSSYIAYQMHVYLRIFFFVKIFEIISKFLQNENRQEWEKSSSLLLWIISFLFKTIKQIQMKIFSSLQTIYHYRTLLILITTNIVESRYRSLSIIMIRDHYRDNPFDLWCSRRTINKFIEIRLFYGKLYS